tara:strand:- start:77 stop:721 length:645 start_codon:yes stop_codon:yes gene_type:complete
VLDFMFSVVACTLALVTPPWRDSRIHHFGNNGLGGTLHAALAPAATRMIDILAYGGVDVRETLRARKGSVVDLGCGTGLSTNPSGIGVDSSAEMLRFASLIHPRTRFARGLAERWGRTGMCDEVHIAFVLHEQSQRRRLRILHNALRICTQQVVVMDIDPSYTPSALMRAGEPYVDSYLNNIEEDIRSLGVDVDRRNLVPGHVLMWELHKPPPT